MATLCGATTLKQKPKKAMNKAQRALFMSNLMWPIGSTIKIYIFDYSDIQIISRDAYDNIAKAVSEGTRVDDRQKYMYWYDFSYVSDDDLNKYFDPLYKTIQGKVLPGQLIKSVVLERFAPLVNLKFEFTNNINDSTVRVKFDSTRGCNSLIGTDNRLASQGYVINRGKTDPTMYLGWLDVSTVIHEFCHVLGMGHEHQNPNNNPIQWNKPVVECYFRAKDGWSSDTTNINVIERLKTDETNGSNYDNASIMVYAFPKSVNTSYTEIQVQADNTQKKVNIACKGDITLTGMSVNPNYKLSNTDIQWLGYIYPMSGNRDPNFVKNLPKDVIPTDVFNPQNVRDIQGQVVDYVKRNWTIIGSVIGGLIGLYILYLIISWLKNRPTDSNSNYSSYSGSFRKRYY